MIIRVDKVDKRGGEEELFQRRRPNLFSLHTDAKSVMEFTEVRK
jgi:hypothetical protein